MLSTKPTETNTDYAVEPISDVRLMMGTVRERVTSESVTTVDTYAPPAIALSGILVLLCGLRRVCHLVSVSQSGLSPGKALLNLVAERWRKDQYRSSYAGPRVDIIRSSGLPMSFAHRLRSCLA